MGRYGFLTWLNANKARGVARILEGNFKVNYDQSSVQNAVYIFGNMLYCDHTH